MNNGEFYSPRQAAEQGVPVSQFNQRAAAYINDRVQATPEVTAPIEYDSGELYTWGPTEVAAAHTAVAAETTAAIEKQPKPPEMGWHGGLGRVVAATAMGLVALVAIPSDKEFTDLTKPSAASRATSEQMLAAPNIPFDIEAELPPSYPKGDVIAEYKHNMAQFRRRDYIAKGEGLTVFDASKVIRDISERGENSAYKLTPEQAFERLKTLAAKHDIELVAGPEDEEYAFNLYGLKPGALDTSIARKSLVGIAKGLAAMPKEYNDRLGKHRVKRIILATTRREESFASAYTDPTDGNKKTANQIVINVSSETNAQIVSHELWHRWQYKLARSSNLYGTASSTFERATGNPSYGWEQGDPRINKPTTIDANNEGFITLNQYDKLIEDQRNNVASHAYSADCAETANQAAAVVDDAGEKTAFPTDYSASEADEHQSEVAGVFLTGDDLKSDAQYNKVTSPHLPLLRAGFVHELSRLGDYDASLRSYFIRVSYNNAYVPLEDLMTLCNPME